jgi:GT2 family glycosyltransferase
MSILPVSIVITTWNSESVILRCLESLKGQGAYDIHIFDNGSEDKTLELLKEADLEFTLHHEVANRGFSYSCNEGLCRTKQPYVFYLNDDATLRPGYLEALWTVLENQPSAASAVGKMVYFQNGTQFIDSAGIELGSYALRPLDIGHGQPDLGQFDTPRNLFGPSATATLYRRSALEKLGPRPFDEEFFAYYEDVDLAWRLGQAGYLHLYEPAAVVEHCRRGPDGKPPALRARAFANRYLLWAKNENPWKFLSYAPLALSWESIRICRRFFQDPEVLREIPKSLGRALEILKQRATKS